MFGVDRLKIIMSNMLYLVSGSVMNLITGFLFNIYIARTLGASEYGIFNSVEAFTAMFGFLLFNGYQQVAIRECCGDKDRLTQVIENILYVKIGLSLLAVVCVIAGSFLFNYSHLIKIYIAIFSFTLFSSSIITMIQVVFHVHSKMKYIALTGMIQKLIYIVPSVMAIWFGGGVEYLIIFFTLSTLVNIFINLYIVKTVFSISFSFGNILRSRFDSTFFNEAMVFSLLGFIGYFHRTIDITMLSWMVSSDEVGYYAAASKLIMTVHLMGRFARVVFYPQIIEIFKEQQAVKASELFKISFIICLLLIPISVLVSFFSSQIITLSFGIDFTGSIPVLKYLAWIIPFGLLSLPFGLAMLANHHEKKMILPNIIRSLCNVVLNYIFIKEYGYMGAVYSTVVTYLWYMICINFGYQYYVLKKAGNII